MLYGRTRTEVRQKLRDASSRAEVRSPVRDSKSTVAAWMCQWRDTTLAASSRKETTRELYALLSKNHLEPYPFGGIRLNKLRPSDIDRLILLLRNKNLSDSTVRQVFTVLRGALDDAVRDGLLARNPAASVKRPGVTHTETRHLSPSEVRALLDASRTSRFHMALSLIAATGLRRGEALALMWSDIDLKKQTLKVRGTLSRVGGKLKVTELKTLKSRRTLRLSPGMVDMLTAHRKVQVAEQLQAGSLWQASGRVFATAMGGPIEPRNLYRALAAAADKAELEGVGIHTLRHSAATAWLENGINLKAVSELLGHANISITADCYGHVTESTSRSAMDTLSAVLGL